MCFLKRKENFLMKPLLLLLLMRRWLPVACKPIASTVCGAVLGAAKD